MKINSRICTNCKEVVNSDSIERMFLCDKCKKKVNVYDWENKTRIFLETMARNPIISTISKPTIYIYKKFKIILFFLIPIILHFLMLPFFVTVPLFILIFISFIMSKKNRMTDAIRRKVGWINWIMDHKRVIVFISDLILIAPLLIFYVYIFGHKYIFIGIALFHFGFIFCTTDSNAETIFNPKLHLNQKGYKKILFKLKGFICLTSITSFIIGKKNTLFLIRKVKGVLYFTLYLLGPFFILIYFSYLFFISSSLVTKLKEDTNKVIFVVSKKGNSIKLVDTLNNIPIKYEDMSKNIIEILTKREDRRFYKHYGVDGYSITRSIIVPMAKFKFKDMGKGASTLTQQLVKNRILTNEKTKERKIKEFLLSIIVDIKLSKQEILELYLNSVPFGHNIHGVELASRRYFNKHAKDLTKYEAALLVQSLPNPSRNYLSKNKKIKAKAIKLAKRKIKELYPKYNNFIIYKKNISYTKFSYVSLFEYSNKEIKRILKNEKNGQYRVITTFSSKMMVKARKTINSIFPGYKRASNVSEIGVVTIDSKGAIKSMITSLNRARSQLNHVSKIRRQLGSTIKPLLYLTALQNGYKKDSIISAQKIRIKNWEPKNSGNYYPREITLREALKKSLNTVAARLIKKLKPTKLIKNIKKVGLDKYCSVIPNDVTIALGTLECSLLGITNTFNIITNTDGYKIKPYSIEKIIDSKGVVVYNYKKGFLTKIFNWFSKNRIINKEKVKDMRYMLSGVTERGGTATRAKIEGYKVIGKTGTTQDNKDAYFIGNLSKYTTGIWVGNDNNSSMRHMWGGRLPAEIFKRYMLKVLNR